MAAKKMSYNDAFVELEGILQKLENNELDVDKITSQVKRASELIKLCKGRLHETETDIEKIISEMDEEAD